MHAPVLIATAATAMFGVVVTTIIRGRKTANVCNPGERCETVLSSRYSNFLGFKLETLGLYYYVALVLAALGGAFMTAAGMFSAEALDVYAFALLGFTGAGFAMSCYLTFVQAFYLRAWCPWCLRSAAAATLSFGLAWLFYRESGADMLPILVRANEALNIAHLVSFALALVAATVSDVVVIRFMRTFAVSDVAERVFRYATQVSVSLLFVVILTFVGLYLPDILLLNQAPAVLAQGIAVTLVAINVAFLNLFVSPYVYDMVARKTVSVAKARAFRRIAFALAATSFVSWYSAFALALYPDLDYHVSTILLGYGIAAVFAVLIGLAFESLSCGKHADVQ